MKYLVVPGHVRSATDRDLHYISASNLMQLYGVRRSDCLIYTPDERVPSHIENRRFDALAKGRIVLRPRSHQGDYSLPKEPSRSTSAGL